MLDSSFQNKSGVYQILNIKNGKRYIGASIKVRERINTHFRILKYGQHNRNFQKDYDIFNIEDFIPSVLEYCSLSDLNIIEQRYVDIYLESELYNVCIEDVCTRKGSTQPEESVKMSVRNSPDISGKNNPMYGNGHKISGKKNGMFGRTGELNPFYGKGHFGNENHFYGKSHSKETKNKIRKTLASKPYLICPYCGLKSKSASNMKRYHFNNCKQNKINE